MGASEGGITQTGTSLGDSRADSATGPSRVLNTIIYHRNKIQPNFKANTANKSGAPYVPMFTQMGSLITLYHNLLI